MFIGISPLVSFPENGLPTYLQSLCILYCDNLSFLPLKTWSNYTSLVSLELYDSCTELISFPLNCFPKLQRLTIVECMSLKSIFISETSSFSSSTLQSLHVRCCKALRSLPQQMFSLTALEDIYLSNLPNLNLSSCEGALFPPNLRSIHVEPLRITKPVTEWGHKGLNALSSMGTGGDHNVKCCSRSICCPFPWFL
jgi:hypothetical protein